MMRVAVMLLMCAYVVWPPGDCLCRTAQAAAPACDCACPCCAGDKGCPDEGAASGHGRDGSPCTCTIQAAPQPPMVLTSRAEPVALTAAAPVVAVPDAPQDAAPALSAGVNRRVPLTPPSHQQRQARLAVWID